MPIIQESTSIISAKSVTDQPSYISQVTSATYRGRWVISSASST